MYVFCMPEYVSRHVILHVSACSACTYVSSYVCICVYVYVYICLTLRVTVWIHVFVCECIWVNFKIPYRSLKSLKDVQKQTKQCCVLWLHRWGKPGPLVQLVERLIRSSVSSYTSDCCPRGCIHHLVYEFAVFQAGKCREPLDIPFWDLFDMFGSSQCVCGGAGGAEVAYLSADKCNAGVAQMF